jgi:hypothetical protein
VGERERKTSEREKQCQRENKKEGVKVTFLTRRNSWLLHAEWAPLLFPKE